MNNTAKLRLFFGLEIPESIKQRLLSIQQPVAGARWQKAEQLHLTLAFLGSVEAQQLPNLCHASRNLPVKAFDLTVAGVGCFGHPDCPKNLWAGVQPEAELAQLHGALNQRLAASGFGSETRTFKPHITLARFKNAPGSVADLLRGPEALVAGSFTVNRFALFESAQGRHGSIYRVLERFPLVAT